MDITVSPSKTVVGAPGSAHPVDAPSLQFLSQLEVFLLHQLPHRALVAGGAL